MEYSYFADGVDGVLTDDLRLLKRKYGNKLYRIYYSIPKDEIYSQDYDPNTNSWEEKVYQPKPKRKN